MASTDVFRVGSLTFIGPLRVDNGTTGYNERARIIVEGLGDISLWGSADEYRAAAQFFLALAHEQEHAHAEVANAEVAKVANALAQSCEKSSGCNCNCGPSYQ